MHIPRPTFSNTVASLALFASVAGGLAVWVLMGGGRDLASASDQAAPPPSSELTPLPTTATTASSAATSSATATATAAASTTATAATAPITPSQVLPGLMRRARARLPMRRPITYAAVSAIQPCRLDCHQPAPPSSAAFRGVPRKGLR